MGDISGTTDFAWRGGDLTTRYDLAASTVESAAIHLGTLEVDGRARTARGFARVEAEGDVSGDNVQLGSAVEAGLASAADATGDTLLSPLLAKFRNALSRNLRGSTFAARFTARRTAEDAALIIPQADLRSASGARLLSLSRAQFVRRETGLPRFEGNFATGGADMPRLSGRMEQTGDGASELRLAMQQYSAGGASLVIPRMTLQQSRSGQIALAGLAEASGALPGGRVQGLRLPLDGTIGANGALALWNGCREVRFASLALANLTLEQQALQLCPARGQPILRYSSAGLRVAAGTNALDLRGRLGDTPIALASGPVGFAYNPGSSGAVSVKQVQVLLGGPPDPIRLTLRDLNADLGAANIGGEFAGTDALLPAIPLDILDASGKWRYADGALLISDGSVHARRSPGDGPLRAADCARCHVNARRQPHHGKSDLARAKNAERSHPRRSGAQSQ